MAQLTQISPTTPNLPIPTPAAADITELTILILVGSGWIVLTLNITLKNLTQNLATAYAQITKDGQVIPGSEINIRIANDSSVTLQHTIAIKPGAGQHTFTVQAFSPASGYTILGTMATLIVHELGY